MTTSLNAGDIAIIGINSDNPDQISFVALTDLKKDTEIKFTDNGVTSSGAFRANEGAWLWTADQNIAAGSVITLSNDGDVSASIGTVAKQGILALASSGDQVIAYQGEDTAPTFIYAVNLEGSDWQNDATSSNTSALPSGLEPGVTAVAIQEVDNAVYQGTTHGSKEALLTAIANPDNWQGDNSTGFAQPTESFTLGNAQPDTTAPTLIEASPTDDAAAFDANSDITLTFDEVIQTGSGNITLKDANGTIVETFDVAISDRISVSGNTLTIDPTNELEVNQSYQLSLDNSAITDIAGNAWTANFSDNSPNTLDFTTSASAPQPTDYTLIHDIQGEGNNGSQAYLGQEVTINAIVTAYVPGLKGF